MFCSCSLFKALPFLEFRPDLSQPKELACRVKIAKKLIWLFWPYLLSIWDVKKILQLILVIAQLLRTKIYFGMMFSVFLKFTIFPPLELHCVQHFNSPSPDRLDQVLYLKLLWMMMLVEARKSDCFLVTLLDLNMFRPACGLLWNSNLNLIYFIVLSF